MKLAARPTWRFALLPALVVAVLSLVMLAFQHRLMRAEALQRHLARNQQRADVLGLQLQLALRDAVGQVRLLARSPQLRADAPPERMRAELDRLIARSPHFVWVGVVALDGRILAGSRGWLEGQSAAQRQVFLRGAAGMVGDVHEAVLLAQLPGGATELIDIGEPVLNDVGDVVAVVTAHVGLAWVREQIALGLGSPSVAAAHGLQALVLTDAGRRSVVPGAVAPPDLPELPQPRAWQAADGTRWLAAQSTLRGMPGEGSGEGPLLPWRTVVLQREDVALASLHGLTRAMLWVAAVTTLLLAGAGFWAARRLLGPWDPLFSAVLSGGGEADLPRIAARVQALVAQRAQPTPTEMLMGWLARDAGNLRRAIDHLPVAIALADRHHRCEYVNPAYTRLLGWTTDALRGRLLGEPLVDAAERDGLSRLYQQLDGDAGEFVSRLDALTPAGDTVAVQWHVVPMFDAQGRPMGVLQIVHDIRAERSARARADAMAGRQRALADAALDTLLATLDLDGRVLEWSRGAEALTGHAAAHALGRTLDTLLPGGFDSTGCLRRARIDGHCDVRLHSHGRRFEGSLYSLGLAPGSARFGLILRDASGHAAAQQQLEATRDELTQLNRRLLAQERQTSQRLAQSLHDELGQTLAALRLHWDVYRGAAAEQRQKLDDRIAQLVVQANRQVRGVLAELRPPLLDELGLAAAIDNEIRQHQPADGDARMTLQAGHDAQLQRWPADVEYAAFMVAREALLNALRHAGAAHITVRLDGDEHLLALSVSDDGQGLVPGPGDGETGRMGHLGLVGMRERALAIDAQLRIDGQPGRGTIVGLTWESAEAPDEVLAEVPADESHLPD